MLYTDPGSGVLLWQILVAGAVGAMFYVRKMISFLTGKRSSQVKAETQKIDYK